VWEAAPVRRIYDFLAARIPERLAGLM